MCLTCWVTVTHPMHAVNAQFSMSEIVCCSVASQRYWRSNIQLTVAVVCWLLNAPQHASVSQRRICSGNLTCCHIEMKVADQTFCRTQSQYNDTGPTRPSADPITPGAGKGSRWSANFEITGKPPRRKREPNPRSAAHEAVPLRPLGQDVANSK